MEWISVKERLPNENVRILVYDGDDLYISEYIKGVFEDLDFGNYVGITHWVLLPEPPKNQ